MKAYLVRQPIFDSHEAVIACELLYRLEEDEPDGGTAGANGDELILSLLGAGIEEVTDGDPALVAIVERMLDERTIRLLPTQGVILQVSADLAGKPGALDTLEALEAVGYTLAVDRFHDSPDLQPLLHVATYVGIDAATSSAEEIAAAVSGARRTGCRVIAMNVDKMPTWQSCKEAGIELFQGRFFRDPEVVSPGGASPETMSVLRLLKLVRDPDNSDSDLEEIFKSDPTLAFRLLKVVNSAAMGGRGIDSIGHALRLLGRQALYRWLSVLLVSSGSQEHDKGREQALTALLRARFLESLGARATNLQEEHLFLVGLFSVIDVLIGVPMAEAVAAVALPEGVREGLLGREGPYGAAVSLIEAYEAGDWPRVSEIGRELVGEEGDLSSLYLEAANWSKKQLAA